MTKIDLYRQRLRELEDWDAFLLAESGLPGPRGNLELAQAVAEEGEAARFRGWLAYSPERAPVNAPAEFLHFCGALGLGTLLVRALQPAERQALLDELRRLASDPRWRTREAVAMALQRWGDADLPALLDEMDAWSRGVGANPPPDAERLCFEQRAAVAALCEPRLLVQPEAARRALALLDRVTEAVWESPARKNDGCVALKKALGYGWSVAAAALPVAGKPLIENWLACPDREIAAVVAENLKKKRLERMDAAWVRQLQAQAANSRSKPV